MDALELCNSLRMEFEGVYENKIPLDALPAKLQDMVLALARQENYSIEYTLAPHCWLPLQRLLAML